MSIRGHSTDTSSSRTVRWGFDRLDQILILLMLENYSLQAELEAAIAAFVEHYNNHRYHESLGNLISAEVYFGRGPDILTERKKIKKLTIQSRRLTTPSISARQPQPTEPEPSKPNSGRLLQII